MIQKVIVPEKMFQLQNSQYREILYLTDTVPALSGGQEANLNVSSKGHFLCEFITGSYQTIASPAGVIVDTGVNYLFGQLRDGSRNLFNERVPLNLILSPGRRKSANSTTVLVDPVGSQFLQPLPFFYLFTVNTNITFNVSNTSDEAVQYEILFHGLRIVSSAAADALRNRAIAENRTMP